VGLSAAGLKRLADHGVLPVAARTSAHGRLFDPRDVDALIAQRARPKDADR
jgi:hypothetical protein